MRLRLVTALVALLAASSALVGASPSVAAADPVYVEPGTGLEIRPAYEGRSYLTVNSYVSDESLTRYEVSLRSVTTGQHVSMMYPDQVAVTETPMQPGETYEYSYKMTNSGYWSCSQYNPNGCTWMTPVTHLTKWRFVFTPDATFAATRYKDISALTVGKRGKWSKRGWAVTVNLTRAGSPLADRLVIGQYKTRGGWRVDDSVRTTPNGSLRLLFRGETRKTEYRLLYYGDSITRAATSRAFPITARRR